MHHLTLGLRLLELELETTSGHRDRIGSGLNANFRLFVLFYPFLTGRFCRGW